VQDHPFSIPSELGAVSISPDAIAQIVAHTASRCYGVVGLVPQTKVARLLGRDTSRAIRVAPADGGVRIDLHVSVEYGLNLAEVASTVRSQVAYEVGRLTGLDVAGVEVHIQKVRRSA
jgi:uncharacterized alkaline shock family protein YloU